MGAMPSQFTSLTIVYSTVYSGAHQRKHQSSASLAFVWGIHQSPKNSRHQWPVTRKMFPFDDVIMEGQIAVLMNIELTDDPAPDHARDLGNISAECGKGSHNEGIPILKKNIHKIRYFEYRLIKHQSALTSTRLSFYRCWPMVSLTPFQWCRNACYGDFLLDRLVRRPSNKKSSFTSLAFLREIHWWPVVSRLL